MGGLNDQAFPKSVSKAGWDIQDGLLTYKNGADDETNQTEAACPTPQAALQQLCTYNFHRE